MILNDNCNDRVQMSVRFGFKSYFKYFTDPMTDGERVMESIDSYAQHQQLCY